MLFFEIKTNTDVNWSGGLDRKTVSKCKKKLFIPQMV